MIKETINPMIHRCAKVPNSSQPYLQDVCGIQYNDESSVCGINADRSYRAVYSGILLNKFHFASDVGIEINKDAHIIIAPNIGSYVGGDITARNFGEP